MAAVCIQPTIDRSVVGMMVELARALPYHPAVSRFGEAALRSVEEWLAETPCHAARSDAEVVFPNEKAPEVLRAKWGWLTGGCSRRPQPLSPRGRG
jgi:hypothetical protein